RRLTATTTAGGMMLVGLPLMLEYVVRPGDTLSEIAERHNISVTRLVERNGLHPSGNQIFVGQTLDIPAAHGRSGGEAAGTQNRISPDARRIVHYTVKSGDTPSELAVRFHAWTAELIEMNGSVLHVGERIRIPVVPAAVAADRKQDRKKHRTPDRNSKPDRRPTTKHSTKSSTQSSLEQQLAQRADPSRSRVRAIIEATCRRYGVDPQLALAVSWQEAGWQQHHVSSADAIGAMQIIPTTGDWMSDVLGRRLDLLDVRDNVTAGVVLLKVLTDAAPQRQAIAGYYQGLAGVRKYGMYDDTKRYVANVLYLKRRFEQGNYPA
ncbi:MAG TPA: LysM peptidoglycan-binding domain-containing protein, partial [Nocardioidaceae bacterium]|nr:LysM peptidoglycan-binding domain-containing protein [Nocardioidaceae bacterium]